MRARRCELQVQVAETKAATATGLQMVAELNLSKLQATAGLEKELAVTKAKLLAGGVMLNMGRAGFSGSAAVTPGGEQPSSLPTPQQLAFASFFSDG